MNFYTPFPRGVYGGGSAATGIMRSNTMDFLGEKDLNYYEMEEQEQQQTTKKMKLDMIESFSLAEDDIEDD